MGRIFLTVAPVLLVLCLAGFGAALAGGLRRRPGRAPPDLFTCALAGLLVVALGVLLANFFVPIGENVGIHVALAGLALFAVLQHAHGVQWNQLVVLVLAVEVVWLGLGNVALEYDTGLYHIPAMNWIAREPLPFGLANFEGRLGFDPGWLLVQAALRTQRLGWGHLIAAEVAIRALALAWLVRGLWQYATQGWTARAMVNACAFVALAPFITAWSETSTDVCANLLAFCAWVVFCNLMLRDQRERQASGPAHVLLLHLLIALAVTFKVAMLPIALLAPALLLRMRLRDLCVLVGERPLAHGVVAIYWIAWLARNFVLTGCLVYPIDATCASVPWGVGAGEARMMATWITGWARHPGPDALDYVGLLDLRWVPAWLRQTGFAWEFKLVAAAVVVLALVRGISRRRVKPHGDPTRRLVQVSAACAACGLALWFLKAPTLRFSWVFFAILVGTLLIEAVRRFDFWGAPLPSAAMPARKRRALGAGLAAIGALALVAVRPVASGAFFPPSVSASVDDWRYFMPVSGDRCWDLHPCTSAPFRDTRVERRAGRLFFERTTRLERR